MNLENLPKWAQELADKYVVTVASGFIAGESLLGVAIALLAAAGVLGG